MRRIVILLCLALLCMAALTARTFDDDYSDCVVNGEVNTAGHDYEFAGGKEATCTEDSKAIYQCIYCGQQYPVFEPALGHNYVSKTESQTCTAAERHYEECSRCGDIINDVSTGTGLGHDYESKHRDATCTEAEADWKECTRCGDIIDYEAGDKAEHSWVEDYKREATCTEKGFVYYRCSVCGEFSKFYDELQPTDHNYVAVETVDATCVDDGYVKYECSYCKIPYTRPVLATGIHSYEKEVIKEVSCVSEGENRYTCSV